MVSSRTRVRMGAADLTQRIHDVQQHRELVQLVYRSHERWPLPPEPPDAHSREPRRNLRISVLDSSFNPPTLAHLALARSTPARSERNSDADYDARLLLLSVRNADKAAPKAGDATYAQRLEMMIILAQELEESPSDSVSHICGNVAVAIIDEPTFVRKSAVLRQSLQDLTATFDAAVSERAEAGKSSPSVSGLTDTQNKQIKLSFIMGFDTLERFLAPRYYNNSLSEMHEVLHRFFAPPPGGDGSEVVCAWRGENKPENSDSQEKLLQVEAPISESQKKMHETLSLAQPFIASGSVSFTLLTDYEMTLSSSEVRGKRLEGVPEWSTMVPSRVSEYVERAKLYIRE